MGSWLGHETNCQAILTTAAMVWPPAFRHGRHGRGLVATASALVGLQHPQKQQTSWKAFKISCKMMKNVESIGKINNFRNHRVG